VPEVHAERRSVRADLCGTQVNLLNAQGVGPLTFWDGNNATLCQQRCDQRRTGAWLAASAPDWQRRVDDSTGALNAGWQANGFAIFQAVPGTVTVDNSAAR